MIEVRDIHKRYRMRNVLNGVSFTAEKGQITCLTGINGAGKSTILKAIMGLTPLKNGQVLIDGVPLNKTTYEKVAFIPDRLTMPLGMKLTEGLRFMADFYDNWDTGRADELMRFFRLEGSDKIGNLSKGTAAKYNLVLGLAQNTDYVLMDEPFSGIDLFSRELISEVFSSHLIEDRGVLLTTHEIVEMEHLIDKAVIMHQGKVVREFNCEEVRSEEGKSIVDVMREVYLG
ncbi:ATP-binding cassette domain-containing protein [Cohnella cholangitidis]|uniref:ABC transporter ATP-binding protein n=1 Tax=Cohnella cholangitidis TaxID=2598458 RepID=A0A7G5C6I7_9BACL|nr:ABC transporter ATP-binding protein [Cohnella cholangitidis]QMV44821.1 ABC transporter ATP-binding protein [Cohnella cholangitidis]